MKIFLSPPHMGGNELKYVKEAFDSNYIAPLGHFVDLFEKSIQDYTKTPNAAALVSGTAGIHLALRLLDIKDNDIVLASSFTFIGSVNAILYQRATPMFIDSDSSWNLSPKLLEEALLTLQKENKKPKALILTHLYGQVAKLNEILEICSRFNVTLIEDAAESLGAFYNNQHTGTFGSFGVFSFNGNKIITTSGGGMLISNKAEHIKKARFYATQARENAPYYEHKEYGYNYRLSNISAAIGVGQMEVLEKRVQQKREIFSTYEKLLEPIREKIDFMPEIPNSRGNRWLTTLYFKDNTNPLELVAHLASKDIETRPLWKPMHMQPLFKNARSFTDGTSEGLFQKGICLPSGTALQKNDLEMIAQEIIGFVKK